MNTRENIDYNWVLRYAEKLREVSVMTPHLLRTSFKWHFKYIVQLVAINCNLTIAINDYLMAM